MTGRSEALAFLEIIRLVDLVQDERSKCLHILKHVRKASERVFF